MYCLQYKHKLHIRSTYVNDKDKVKMHEHVCMVADAREQVQTLHTCTCIARAVLPGELNAALDGVLTTSAPSARRTETYKYIRKQIYSFNIHCMQTNSKGLCVSFMAKSKHTYSQE